MPKQEAEELSKPGENGMLYIQIRSVQKRESKIAFETLTEKAEIAMDVTTATTSVPIRV